MYFFVITTTTITTSKLSARLNKHEVFAQMYRRMQLKPSYPRFSDTKIENPLTRKAGVHGTDQPFHV